MAGLVFHSLQDLPEAMRQQAAKKMLAAAKTCPVAAEERTSKMHNVPTVVAGIRFDSKKEARRYEELMTLLQLGKIRELRLQQEFTLQEAYTTPEGRRIRAIRYRADFVYIDCATERRVIEDVKGRRTDVYMMKRKMMAQRGYDIREV